MNRALADLIAISKHVGTDSMLVGVGGGNTSVKSDDGRHMYIKASGAHIRDVAEDRGWRRLNLEAVRSILSDPWIAQLPEEKRQASVAARLQVACEDEVEGGRPSTESPFHALLGRCVAHLHPPAALAYVCAKNGREEVERILGGDELPPLWVPYTNPGYSLARRMARLMARYEREHGTQPAVVFLEKHGLLVSAEETDVLLAEVARVVRAVARPLARSPAAPPRKPAKEAVSRAKLALRRGLFEATGERVCVRHHLDRQIAGLLDGGEAKTVASQPALTPDEIVYANGALAWLEKTDMAHVAGLLRRRIAAEGMAPAAFLVSGLGVFAAGGERALGSILDMARSALLIKWQAARLGGANPLGKAQRRFIAQWEAESYRRKLAAGTQGGELAGRIALVTGAGSGLGRAIAVGLAKEGAVVGLADIDRGAAAKAVEMIREQASGGAAVAVSCDVTNEGHAGRACERLLEEWGGLDILVNAAGVAPAYDLTELPAAQWERALAVNLTGYFLMGRAAARIMVEQGMGGSIVNLSSKSGLEASKSNTPYNATKAGEIHMARGWALELGEHGIRVNSVAPGNVFQDSKIWGPEYIAACAKKYGIQPSEVIPYYVGKTALKREIVGQDVADAVVFLCSDRARTITGQTLVPDGGQVPVR